MVCSISQKVMVWWEDSIDRLRKQDCKWKSCYKNKAVFVNKKLILITQKKTVLTKKNIMQAQTNVETFKTQILSIYKGKNPIFMINISFNIKIFFILPYSKHYLPYFLRQYAFYTDSILVRFSKSVEFLQTICVNVDVIFCSWRHLVSKCKTYIVAKPAINKCEFTQFRALGTGQNRLRSTGTDPKIPEKIYTQPPELCFPGFTRQMCFHLSVLFKF